MAKLFRNDGTDIFLDTDFIEFYIPDYYFDEGCGFATDFGATIQTFGIICVGLYEKGKLSSIKRLQIPMDITLESYDTETRDIDFATGPMKCRVLKYMKGQKIMQYRYVKGSKNTVRLLNMILYGYIPKFVPYDQVYFLLLKSCEQHSVNLGVPNYLLEILITTVYRYIADPSKKFSEVYGKEDISSYDYQTVNIRKACQYASTFSAITFEDIDSMVTSSLNRSATHKAEPYSPLEEVIKY